MNDKELTTRLAGVYECFNSACIISTETLSITTSECSIEFDSIRDMNIFLLNEIEESIISMMGE